MIDYLLIGHVSTDLTPDGPKPGGAVTFASRVAHVLDYKTAVLTSAAPDYDLISALPEGVEVVSLPADATTVFENIYNAQGDRVQTIYSQAGTITAADVPEAWRSAKIVHLAPIANEIDVELVRLFSESVIGVTPQGWLRDWDDQGHVFAKRAPNLAPILPLISAVVASEEDLVNPDQVEKARAALTTLVVTNGSQGCMVIHADETRHFVPPRVEAVDATGAGDTFATAFFICLYETGDPWQAARFANLLAARSVTQPDPASKMAELQRIVRTAPTEWEDDAG
jgi:sugar/nucleoside kinase (ribokinase family)